MKNYQTLREFFIWKESGYDTSKSFKTEELAKNYAKKMNYENYEIRVTYQMTRK